MHTTPLWGDTATLPRFPKLDRHRQTECLIIGGGITGLTAAYLLRKAGRSVILVERGRLAEGETAHTTAHVTQVTDLRLSDLVETFGRDHAKAVWDAGAEAMNLICQLALESDAECELRQIPGYLVAAQDDPDEIERLRAEAHLGVELGFNTQFVPKAPLLHHPAMVIGNQLKFHPRKYLAALAQAVQKLGGEIYEETAIEELESSPRQARTAQFSITCGQVILATHVPLQGTRSTVNATLFQSKLAAYSTYVVQAVVPPGTFPEMLWWDTVDPYHYVRIDRHAHGDVLIAGGEDQKTGQGPEPSECYHRLERRLRALAPMAKIERRWSGQVIETVDGLPYLGEVADGEYIATGFSGNGMTFGTLGALLAADGITGRSNPWRELFCPDRKKLSATWDYLKENSDYPCYLLKSRLQSAEAIDPGALEPGEGKLIRLHGKRVAAYRDDHGHLHEMSPVCPHMGCVVRWNEAEKTWDCPCHGSRFAGSGAVIAGPAESPLTAIVPAERKG